jgi:predicted RNA-binding protein with PUA-like domain
LFFARRSRKIAIVECRTVRRPMRYWLMKSEPDEFSIDDLERDKTTPWFGVRNFQARNFMKKEMSVGDRVFFYHSSCAVPGIAGIAEVSSPAYPDATQFQRASPYFDPASRKERPRWYNVDVRIVKKTRLVSLSELRRHPELSAMRVLKRGNRLSITPVEPEHWKFITARLMEEHGF